MRVTGNMISEQIIQNLNIDLARLQDVHQQISTTKRINKPSDAPLGAQRVVNINEALAGVEQYKKNADYVTSWVTASETTLNSVVSIMNRANTLAIRAANDATLTQDQRNTMADEVNSILNRVLELANTANEGKRIFGGHQTLAEPFQATMAGGEVASVAYAGDNGIEQVEVDAGWTVNKNVPGSTVFMPGAGGTDVFASLINLRDDLRANNAAGIQSGIAETRSAHDQIVNQVSVLGNKTNMLELTSETLADKKLRLTTLGSQLADTDMPEAIVQLQSAQNVYQAAVESSARILQLNGLMHFLK